jgi:hypothetical protein
MSQSSRSEPSTSTDIRAIDSNVSLQIGANQKESIIEFEEDLRARLSCHQYVSISVNCAGRQTELKAPHKEKIESQMAIWTDLLMASLLDWVWLKQDNSPHDALWPQSFPSP